MIPKKVAIISDVMMSEGGAERVVFTFLEMFPDAELFSLLITKKAASNIFLKHPRIKVHTSIFQFLHTLNVRYLSLIKIFSWLYWEFLNLDKFDLVISSSHSFMSKNVKKRTDAFHLSYIHTTPRYLYEEFNEMSFVKKIPWKYFLWPIFTILRQIDKNGSKNPDILVANSVNVKNRIWKYYGRDSVVIYPPVDVVYKKTKKSNYFVCLSRLVKQKGIELAVKTCSRHNIKLVVIGNGPELNNLKRMANQKVTFKVNCDDNEKHKILSRAKALIYTSKNEDFGMVPVEALGLGVPVIGYNSGGTKESVINGKNGILFNDFSEKSLLDAINLFNKSDIKVIDCVKFSKKFTKKIFIEKIRKIINDQ